MKFLLCLFLMPYCCFAHYYSQIGQDEFANTYLFRNRHEGVFVDIGAHNGVTFSNSCFFEKELNWSGLCVEPIPEVFEELEKNRNCFCLKGCVTDFSGTAEFLRVRSPNTCLEMLSGILEKYDPQHLTLVERLLKTHGGSYEIINVECYLINDLLEKFHLNHIDFLSLDTEGGEFDIITTIDYLKYKIDVITLEDNYRDDRFIPFLESKGYQFICRNQWDLLFVRNEFMSEHNLEKDRLKDLHNRMVKNKKRNNKNNR